jgi:mRNA interferase MazF
MVDNYVPDYADVVWVVLEPRIGHEQSGRRPAIVISKKDFSAHTSLAIMCPITSHAKGLPFEVIYKGAEVKGAVLPVHAKSLDWSARKVKLIEKAPIEIADKVAEMVGAIIGLD